MLDAQTQALLQDIVRRQSRSLLQYVSEAFPWTTPEEQGALEVIRGLIVEEQALAASVAKFLQRAQVGVPYTGSYPKAFTTINYVSLDYLLPLLIKQERASLEVLEREAEQIGNAEARALVDQIVAVQRRHVTTLEGLAPKAKPTAAVH